MKENVQSVIVTYADGSRVECDNLFFAALSQDGIGASMTVHCDGGFVLAGSAALVASSIRVSFEELRLSRWERITYTARTVCKWLRALIVAMKEVEVPHE